MAGAPVAVMSGGGARQTNTAAADRPATAWRAATERSRRTGCPRHRLCLDSRGGRAARFRKRRDRPGGDPVDLVADLRDRDSARRARDPRRGRPAGRAGRTDESDPAGAARSWESGAGAREAGAVHATVAVPGGRWNWLRRRFGSALRALINEGQRKHQEVGAVEMKHAITIAVAALAFVGAGGRTGTACHGHAAGSAPGGPRETSRRGGAGRSGVADYSRCAVLSGRRHRIGAAC